MIGFFLVDAYRFRNKNSEIDKLLIKGGVMIKIFEKIFKMCSMIAVAIIYQIDEDIKKIKKDCKDLRQEIANDVRRIKMKCREF